MAKTNRPRKGSLQYVPRKRAKRETPRIHAWPQKAGAKILGYTAYKAGMTHVMVMDDTKNSPTNGMEVALPVTILEVPPMKVVGVRIYRKGYDGMAAVSDIWAEAGDAKEKKDKKSKHKDAAAKLAEVSEKISDVSDVRLIACAQADKTNMPKKKSDVMEVSLGGDKAAKLDYAKQILGREISVRDVFNENDYVDVVSVTKGKRTQGVVKRYGAKKQPRKATKKRRHLGTGGPWSPSRKMWMEPQPGHMGYSTRTEYNKLILKIGENGSDVTPAGGFLRYGPVSGSYLIIHGSVPGPAKRIVRLTHPRRPHPSFNYSLKKIDLTSKQGM